MPADAALDQPTIDGFERVRLHFVAHPDPACIPLFLGAFGDGMGLGVYQLCDDVLCHFSREQLAPHFDAALRSARPATRWWASHWAMQFPHPSLLPAVAQLIAAEAPEDEDARYFLVSALEFLWRDFKDVRALDLLHDLRATETRPDIREILDQVP